MTAVEILTAMADPEQGEYRGALVEEVLAYLDHGMRDEWDCGLDEKEMWGPSELQIAAKSALSLAIYHEEKPEVEIKALSQRYSGALPTRPTKWLSVKASRGFGKAVRATGISRRWGTRPPLPSFTRVKQRPSRGLSQGTSASRRGLKRLRRL
jgi:hypothetical protein